MLGALLVDVGAGGGLVGAGGGVGGFDGGRLEGAGPARGADAGTLALDGAPVGAGTISGAALAAADAVSSGGGAGGAKDDAKGTSGADGVTFPDELPTANHAPAPSSASAAVPPTTQGAFERGAGADAP